MNNLVFLKDIQERLERNGTFFKRGSAAMVSCMDVFKNYLLKKNLVVVSKSEWLEVNRQLQEYTNKENIELKKSLE